MERNIGDQLNKAFEVYRQASIEKDNAKKELQQMTEYYERYTQKLQQQIEDQRHLIAKLEAQLLSSSSSSSSSAKQPPGEMKCEPVPRQREDETVAPCNHLLEGTAAFRRTQYRKENMETAVTVPPKSSMSNSVDNQNVLDVFEAIQGEFQQIQSLTRRQKDHLKRLGGSDTSNDQQFSMPIQCTDGTAEQAERPFPSALCSPADAPPSSATALASRGTSPEHRDLVESLAKLSVKFPPPTDSEYEFLNSAPERTRRPPGPRSAPSVEGEGEGLCEGEEGEEEEAAAVPVPVPVPVPVEPAVPFVYPLSPSAHSAEPGSASLPQETVRGPQQPLWSPRLCHVADMGTEPPSVQSGAGGSGSPDKCAFCHAVVPQERMNSHLYSHFSHKSEAGD